MVQALTTYYNSSYRNAPELMNGSPYLHNVNEFAPVIARFSKLGESLYKGFIKDTVAGRNPMRILELGCGSGIYLKSAFESNQNATGIGIDIDMEVVKQARHNLVDWGIDDRFRILEGEITESSFDIDGSFDLITMYNLLYYFPVEKRIGLFIKLRSLLSPDGILSIVNTMQGPDMDFSTANLNLAATTLEGITPLPDLDATIEQLNKSGLNRIKTVKLVPGSSVYGIIAKPK